MHRLATVAALGLGAAVLTMASAVPALAAAPRSKTTTTATTTTRTRTRTDGAAVARVAARTLAAPAPAAKARATPDPTVTISTNCAAFCFVPEQVTVAVGDTVTWVNRSGAGHTVTRCTPAACDGTSGGTGTDTSFSSANVAAASGTTFSHTFTAAGTYVYYCQIHGYALMHGTVTVTAAATTTTPASSPTASTLATSTTAPALPSSPQLASTGGNTDGVTVLAVLLIVCGLGATTFRSRRRHA
ncbi:MAG: plastocyanin/azurin family copper-binding protein [Acidimicrobiia bacterium]